MSTTADGGGTVSPKLPLGQTIGLSYSTYFRNFTDVLKISWLWLLVVAPLTGLVSWLQMSWLAGAIANAQIGTPPAIPIGMTIVLNSSSVIVLFAGFSIAVAWHRRLLLDERPGISGSNVVTRDLWRYIGTGIVMCLVIGLPALAIVLPLMAMFGVAKSPLVLVVLPIVYVACLAAMMRLILLLPARAIGDTGLTFKQMWTRSRGNIWRLFWGFVACTVPPIIIAEVIVLALFGFPNPATIAGGAIVSSWIIDSVVLTSYYLLVTPISIGFMSHAYRYFFPPAHLQAP